MQCIWKLHAPLDILPKLFQVKQLIFMAKFWKLNKLQENIAQSNIIQLNKETKKKNIDKDIIDNQC